MATATASRKTKTRTIASIEKALEKTEALFDKAQDAFDDAPSGSAKEARLTTAKDKLFKTLQGLRDERQSHPDYEAPSEPKNYC